MQILNSLLRFLPFQIAYAHCDIPCGIYDPYPAQIAAHSVIRMTQLIQDEKETDPKMLAYKIARLTKVKEEHAEMVKHEVRVIWGDYFKPEHLKEHPHLHDVVFKIMKLASKARQGVDIESAQDLLSQVQEFAEIFWKTKEKETTHIQAPYPSGGELVLPK